ncbi:MAG: YggT family protein [Anaerolineae bacterium]|nr:YggT family protein [Anaerolineae bacterium]
MDVLLNVIFLVLRLFQLILLVRVLLSFFPDIDRSNPIVQFLYDVTEPVLQPIREMLPQTGMVDWSPLVVFLGIFVLMQLISIIA